MTAKNESTATTTAKAVKRENPYAVLLNEWERYRSELIVDCAYEDPKDERVQGLRHSVIRFLKNHPMEPNELDMLLSEVAPEVENLVAMELTLLDVAYDVLRGMEA